MTTLLLRTCLVVSLLSSSVALAVSVPYERIRASDSDAEPHNWLTYSGNYRGWRHSSLDQITKSNVAKLKPLWIYQIRDPGKVETSPIVVDGILYITEKPYIVTALDGRTGRPIWSYRRPPVNDVPQCCGQVNRGLAILGDTLYHVTLDAHLIALDVHTGKLKWDVTVADYKTGHSMTVAPLAVKDKIIVGISGGEFGIRGFLDAYDAKTGERAWRRWTIPGPGEPGNDTWGGNNSWENGAGATWVTGVFDPELNLIYWGTGNPGPDYNGDVRPGDNLYTNCILALDADTGEIRWHFQYTPHDLHDWDSNQVPVLLDAEIAGKPRKLVVQANRNAFHYVLDRVTGEFITGKAYAKQTWAEGLDAKGRPILLPGKEPSAEGTLVYPGLAGATNWFSPSYSPRTKLLYVQAQEDYAQVFFKLKSEYEPGSNFEGGGTRDVAGVEAFGVVKALVPTTGDIKWEFKLHSVGCAGLLSTAGGVVFGGNREGYFFALDDETGKPLWRFMAGGQIAANPISYLVDGKQHVAIAAGNAFFVFGLE